jgi:hypothetical protein
VATVNMFWHGGALPIFAWPCMRSFIERGHSIRLFSYRSIDVPPGVVQVDATAIIPAHELHRYRSIPAFSDIFRYELLSKEGGWWSDVDVVCLTDKLPDSRYAWAEQESGTVNGAILKFPEQDPIVARLAARARELSGQTNTWGIIGPRLLSDVLCGYNPADRSGSKSTFYPLHWLEAPLLLLPEYKSEILHRAKNAMFLHLWSNVFKEIGIDLNRELPEGGFMDDLIAPCQSKVRPSLWTQLRIRHAIKKYWRQPWIKDRWCRTFGQENKLPRVQYQLLRRARIR